MCILARSDTKYGCTSPNGLYVLQKYLAGFASTSAWTIAKGSRRGNFARMHILLSSTAPAMVQVSIVV